MLTRGPFEEKFSRADICSQISSHLGFPECLESICFENMRLEGIVVLFTSVISTAAAVPIGSSRSTPPNNARYWFARGTLGAAGDILLYGWQALESFLLQGHDLATYHNVLSKHEMDVLNCAHRASGNNKVGIVRSIYY